MYYPSETQVTPLVNVRRERILPAPGEVVVRLGERVEPTQIVARANLPGDFRVLPVAHQLGVPASKIKTCMRVKVGDEVRRGQVIAKRGSRSVKSAIIGVLASSGGGRVLVEAQPMLFELRAYIHGTVTNVLEKQGVVVETTGAVIQGMWGAGGESFGVLKRVVKSPDKPLRARDIDPACHGTIVIGGSGLSEAVLERVQELQVRGIVTGGLPPELIEQAKHSPIPIIATEGIGTIPMSEPIFQLLTTNDGREASISGRTRPRWGVIRPEIIVALPAESLPSTQSQPGTPLTMGARVRVVRAPYLGQVGTVVALVDHARRIETDARVRGADVDLGDGTPVFIPLVNLEVLR
jgi:biotin carboxyl carrier protein